MDVSIAEEKSIYEVDLVANDGEVKAQFRMKIHIPSGPSGVSED